MQIFLEPQAIFYTVGFRQSKTALFDWLMVLVVVVVAILTLIRIIRSVVTGQVPVTLEWQNTSGKKQHKQNLIVSRVDFIVLVLSLEAVGVRGYCRTAVYGSRKSVGSSVLRAFPASNACFARDEPSSKRVGGVGLQPKVAKATVVALHSAESRRSYSRRNRRWQNGIDTARCCRHVIHAAGERSEAYATLTCGKKQQQ